MMSPVQTIEKSCFVCEMCNLFVFVFVFVFVCSRCCDRANNGNPPFFRLRFGITCGAVDDTMEENNAAAVGVGG
eukprot:m.217263 g.217263  ORF g.217263 m.217263 type:complete len:74 (-) comp33233_c10_seq1:110-331(-)